MIRIKPAWNGKRSEDIQALYFFLLYRTLPFAPCDYLPEDENGFYYYPDGNRRNPRIYPKHPGRRFKLHRTSLNFLDSGILSGYFRTIDAEGNITEKKKPDDPKELLSFVSPDLHHYLYGADSAVDRANLRNLLITETDQETIEKNGLDFHLNPELLAIAPESADDLKKYKCSLWKLLLDEIFSYDAFSRHELFPKLVQMLEVPVCPYCNRAFTTTARKKDGAYHRQNQVDHYRAKSLYPWFALTLPNLIPSCGSCNLKKGDAPGYVLYPYEEEFGALYRFRTVPVSGVGYLTGQPNTEEEFKLEIAAPSGAALGKDLKSQEYQKRVQRSIEEFCLDTLYRDSHNSYVCGIFEQRYIFNDAYIDSLIDSFPEYFKCREDVRRLLYLKEYDEASLDRSPLAKLTCDMDTEISKLT